MADSLFGEGQFQAAAVQFEREAFFAPSPAEKNRLLLQKAHCYKALGDFATAREIAGRIGRAGDDSLQRAAGYERVLLAYLSEDYAAAENERLRLALRFGELTELLPLQFLILLHSERIDEAKALLVSKHDEFNLSEEEAHLFFPKKWKLKDPDKAYNLSFFLPGVGQMYAGHFFKGMVSGGIQLGLVAFTAYHVWNGYFFSGGMTGAGLFYTFYLGGARYAKNLATAKNKQLIHDIESRFITAQKK